MDTSTFKTLKRTDPIWKRLLLDRIWVLLFLVALGVYLYFEISYAWETSVFNNASLNVFYSFIYVPLIFLASVVNHFRKEQYWKSIGQRRFEALHDPQPFIATSQPSHDANALTLPVTLRLRWNRVIVVAILVLGLVPVVLLVIFGFRTFFQHTHPSDSFIPLVFSVIALVGLGIIVYFMSIHYQFSSIEVTEEGIKTRYMRQDRFLRWDEARIFASYGAQGLKKSTYAFTYELANEQTVVRWSEHMLGNSFLTLESSVKNRDDWNWLIARINTLVAARTDLPLLDLSDRRLQKPSLPAKHNQFSTKPSTFAASHDAPPAPIRIAQDDPTMRRLQWNGEKAATFGVLFGISIVILLVGFFGKFWNYGQYHSDLFSLDIANFLLGGGILLLGLLVLILGGTTFARKYWELIAKKQQEAFQQPERFLVSAQPEPYPQLLSPTSVHIQNRKGILFLSTLTINFVLWSFFTAVVFQQPHRSFLAALLTALLLALLMTIFSLPFTGRSTENRIEVRADGISTRFGTTDTHMKWEEARLFARYGRHRVNNASPRIQNYELASEHNVVRWQELHSRRWMRSIEPQMSQEEFDRWLEQLHGHIVAQTGLALLDLDANSRGEIS